MAHAGKVYPAWVIPQSLNVRSGPGTDRDRIGSLTRGTKVHVTAFANNWCWAKLPDGRWGWVAEWLLQFSADKGRKLAAEAGAGASSTSSQSPPAWIEPEVVNVRSGPGTHYNKRGQLRRGDKVYIIKSERGWRKCRTPGGYGWIREDLLERDVERGRQLARSAGSSHTTPSSDLTSKGYVDGDGVRLRSGPGTSYGIKASLAKGQTLYVTEHRGEWYRAQVHHGQDGWIHESLVKFEGQSAASSSSSSSSTTKGYVNGSRVHLRAGPSLNERIKAKVVRGQTLYVTERDGDWYHARVHGGDEGWIHASLVKLAGESDEASGVAKAWVAGSRVHLRAGPGTEERIKALVVEGQTLYVTETRGDWAHVRVHGGEEGWIHASLVKYAGEEPPSQPAPSHTGEDLTAWIGEDVVNVRYGPGTDHGVKFKLSRGEQVTVVEQNGHWCKVKDADGSAGWVAGWVMNFKGPDEDPTATEGSQDVPVRTAWVARPEVNVRSGPGTDHEEVGEATLGTEVIILDREGDWYKVALDNGTTGYMASWLLDTRAQRRVRQGLEGRAGPAYSGTTGGSRLGRAFVDTAMQYLGSSYVRGGSSPSGFDCSGFVSFVLRQHGVRVSRSSRTLFHEGTPISRSQLQPGDVVFFRNTYRSGISHVGLYMGGNQFIHASNRRGGVKISSLDSAYYAPRYAGARRMR
ncbi:MAG: SH3 domain-containing protein [Armatimonadota bacterium]|nr:SH3 domain-containing protein [Armatimonadota bacterium]